AIPPLGKFLNPYTGIWQNEKDDSTTGELILNGLKNEVSVHYDEHLIPHVFAKNDIDLYRAQGYITAKHRLWQMEFQTYAAAGRLSEIIGKGALNYDREERRRGMGYGAEKAILKMQDDAETLSYLEAYRDGVNDYINSLIPKDYPVEYKLLDYSPKPWTIKKTALLLMYMTKDLASGDDDFEYTNAMQLFGKDRFDLLFPDFFDINDPVIPKDTDWSFIDTPITPTPAEQTSIDSLTMELTEPHPDNGSNNWAISGTKSYSGNPILANDPHLGLNLPSIWFVMQLSTPEYNAFGATLPGALGVISGFNTHIAWGETNATRDVLDWYKIEFKDERRKHYKFGDSYLETTKRIEEIKVRGAEAILDTVVYTHHGPVVFDKNYKDDHPKEGYALKWIGHLGGNNQRPFLKLNKAKTYDDYLNAIKEYTAPAQNFVFASTEGDIALWIQGKFPNKWKGQGKFVMDGTNPEHDWQSFIPQQYNAHTKNPERGFVSSANQHPVDASYPFYVFNDGYEAYRNRVINTFLSSNENITIDDFKGLQNNNYNLLAAEMLPTMLQVLENEELSAYEVKFLNIMKQWNFHHDINNEGPGRWSSWWNRLYNLTWDEFKLEDLKLDRPFDYQTTYMLRFKGDDDFMDIIETPEIETAKDLIVISFKETAKAFEDWEANNGTYKWNNEKGVFVGHLLQALPAFSRFNIAIGGDSNAVNAVSKNHGPSWRMIVELTSPPTALGIYPGGQSGNPGSKYYDNFIDDWSKGNYYNLLFIQDPNKTENIIATQSLIPAK
ncbi:MAG: penicillin acylase family protein, partial [Winogradskyella sp.]|nr:penicillin acylase family protein [Winogradskyella sp.]